MSRLVLATDQAMVYDDFLPAEDFEPLFGYAESVPYVFTHDEMWHKAWSLTDGLPLFGKGTFFRDDGAYTSDELQHYPTRTALDPLLAAIRGAANDAEAIIGKSGVHWSSFVVNPFLHPRGTGLSLHRDGIIYTGAVVFYVHREWNVHWGGHLLILDSRTGAGVDVDDPQLYSFLSDENENRVVTEPGIALCILPKPNRLVILNGNAYHMITRVDDNAGDRPRITLSGFFIKPGA